MLARKKVFFAINNLGIGGAERMLIAQANHIDREKFEPCIVTLYKNPQPNLLASVSRDVRIEARDFSSLLDLPAFYRLYRLLRAERPAAVITSLFDANLLARAAAVLARVPVMLSYEQNVYESKRRWQIIADRLLARWTKKIVAVSREVLEFTLRQERLSRDKFAIIPNAITLQFTEAKRRRGEILARHGLPADMLYIVAVGSLTEQKGHAYLIDAAAEMKNRGAEDFKILIFGRGVLENKLKQKIQSLGLQEEVKLMGYSPIEDILPICDIFALPSLWEGLSLALLEAMSAGSAIVATKVSGTNEVLADGVNGLVVSPKNSSELAESLIHLLEDSESRDKLAQGARKRAEDFAIEKNMEALEKLIAPSRPRVALMSYAMDNRPGKGTALYTRKLIENLLRDDRYDFYLVHYDKVDDPLYRRAGEIVMPAFRLPYGSRFVRQLMFFWQHRKERFDIIHWFQPRLYPFFWLAPADRIVVTAHGGGDITAATYFVFSRAVFNFIMRRFQRHIDACIAVSEFARGEISDSYGMAKDKIFVTYNGGGEDYHPLNKTEAMESIRTRYRISRPYILDISRLEPYKNISNLIRAYVLAKREGGFDHDLVIVGFKGRGYKEAFQLASASEFGESIHFIDYVEEKDLNALYSAADLFIFPSLNEGFGLPIVEAMASGTPVVTSSIASMPEIGGDAVLLVDPHDPEGIALKIRTVLSDRGLADSLIQKGLERAQLFTWAKTAEATKRIYDMLTQI